MFVVLFILAAIVLFGSAAAIQLRLARRTARQGHLDRLSAILNSTITTQWTIMDSLPFSTAPQLAPAIRTREVTAVEVVRAQLDHIERHDPAINAIVALDAERALQRAREADEALARGEIWGALHGVPSPSKTSLKQRACAPPAAIRHLQTTCRSAMPPP